MIYPPIRELSHALMLGSFGLYFSCLFVGAILEMIASADFRPGRRGRNGARPFRDFLEL